MMAGSDYCNISAVAANSLCMYLHVCVCCAFHCFNITEGAKTLFELLWGQLRSRTRKETRVWKKPTPPSKMSAHLLILLLVINGRGKCPPGIKDLTHTSLSSQRIFQSLDWTAFYRRLIFCKVLVQCFIMQQGLCDTAFCENKLVII